MAAPRNALGRGLGALLPSPSTKPLPPPPVPALEVHETGFREIAVERIDPNPEQPRRHFDEAHLQELVQSVKRHGVLQPVVVRRAGGALRTDCRGTALACEPSRRSRNRARSGVGCRRS